MEPYYKVLPKYPIKQTNKIQTHLNNVPFGNVTTLEVYTTSIAFIKQCYFQQLKQMFVCMYQCYLSITYILL